MKPLFTIHAGEYLVGLYIEEHYPDLNLWVPSKDTGIDFLVTDAKNRRTVSLQVKFSKDFVPMERLAHLQHHISAIGWWTHHQKKIVESAADLWVFVLPSFMDRQTHFIILTPEELLQRLRSIHRPSADRVQSYLWVTKGGHCWEARGLKKKEHEQIARNEFTHAQRDFSAYLDNWSEMERRLRG